MANFTDQLKTALGDRYVIESELGEGGMALVYLATDVRHDRKVALKVLRPELAAVIGAERFLAEIKTTANLQHPNILALYDSGEAGSYLYYVMPYIDGESLRDRLDREKQLSIEDAVSIAGEIASALDYAHRQNIIHRDIKPENVLLHDGRAMVADFGIALAVSSAGATRMTETGMSLGTPHYMSPEQAMGERELTARSDVYALGAVTYEMLVGEPPFSGPTAQAIVARVVTEAPRPLIPMRHTVPQHVEAATLKALEKLPADRFSSAAEFRNALKNPALTVSAPTAAATAARPTGKLASAGWSGWIAAGAMALVAGWLAVTRPDVPEMPVIRFAVDIPEARPVSADFLGNTLAISPDGSKVAYVGRAAGGRSQLWLREESSLGPIPLPGTEGADGPFFSPDGSWLGFTSNGRILKVGTDGTTRPVVIAERASRVVSSGAWLDDGTVVFSDAEFNLLRIPETGGDIDTLLVPEGYAWVLPTALPGSRGLLVSHCTANCATMALVALDLATGERAEIASQGTRGWYLPTGHVAYVLRDGTVMARRFDLGRLEPAGPAVALFNQVQMQIGITPEFAVAEDGTIMYFKSDVSQGVSPVRVDRTGTATPYDSTWVSGITSLALSPDNSRLAVGIADGRRDDIWIKDLPDGPLTRLTFEGALNYRPAWQADGRGLSFTSDRDSGYSYLYATRADGSSPPSRVTAPGDTTQVDESLWTRDGRYLIYRAGIAEGFRNIHLFDLRDSSHRPLVVSRFDAYSPTVSRDGRWLAYVSIESGREEVYVRPFPDSERARWLVSPAGGAHPRWSRTRDELYYIDAQGMMTAAQVTILGDDLTVGGQQQLFATDPYSIPPFHQAYDVTADGNYFVMMRQSMAGQSPDLVVVLNWFQEVEEMMGR